MTLSPADYAVLNAAVLDLRAWDVRQHQGPGSVRVNLRLGQVAENLERIATAREGAELPFVLRLYPYAEDLAFLEYAVVNAGVAGDEAARETRLAAVALLTRLRDAQAASTTPPPDVAGA